MNSDGLTDQTFPSAVPDTAPQRGGKPGIRGRFDVPDMRVRKEQGKCQASFFTTRFEALENRAMEHLSAVSPMGGN